MEDMIKNSMEDALKSQKVIDKFKPHLGKALLKYCEKHDIKEPELYVLLQMLIKDMEDSNPILKKSSDIAENMQDMIKNAVKDLTGVDIDEL